MTETTVPSATRPTITMNAVPASSWFMPSERDR
jgi:hypothetical protein